MKNTSKMISMDEAQKRFNVAQYKTLASTFPYCDGVVLIEGDVKDDFFGKEFIDEDIFQGERKTCQELIIIDGDLTLDRDLSFGCDAEPNPSLLVLGDLRCGTVMSGDEFMHITGDAHIKYAINGHFSKGAMVIQGTTHVPYVLNYNHCLEINPSDDAIVINYYDDSDDFFKCNYHSSDLIDVFVPELFELSEEEVAELDEDEKEDVEFCRITFLNRLEKGEALFRKDAKPKRERF